MSSKSVNPMPDDGGPKRPPRVTDAARKARAAKKGKPRKRTEVLPPVYLEPWEKQRGEGASRYEAFLAYRDQPEQGQIRRSLERAAHTVGKAPGTLENWSREDHWRERCAAWDRHLQSVRDHARIRKLEEIAEREAMQLAGSTAALAQPIQALLQRIQTIQQANGDAWENVDIEALTSLAVRAARAMPMTVAGERLVHGLSTANVDAHVHVDDRRQAAEAMSPVERERFLLGEGVDDGRAGERERAARRVADRR